MEIRTSVQKEINELQEYIKSNQERKYRTMDLQVNESAAPETIELKNAEEIKRC